MNKLILFPFLFLMLFYNKSEAQVLKNLGKRIEKKVEERIDRKMDRNVDKVLDKADQESDKPLDEALNKSSSKENKEKDQVEKSVNELSSGALTPAAGGLVMLSDNCSDFIWFKKGAMMEFEFKDGQGKLENKSRMVITKIYNEEPTVVVADVHLTDDMGNDLTMNYKCAGDKLYMDFAAAMESAMKQANVETDSEEVKTAVSNTRMGFSDGFLSFPKNMYPGQRLDDVTFTMETGSNPQFKMNVTSELLERKVEAREKITTSAGTFDCLKISGKRSTKMKVMGMNKNMGKPIVEYVWFSPGIGMVKQESYDEKGKLESSSQLTAYKF